MYYLVCPIGTIAGKEDFLTYSSDKKLAKGAIVSIPFGTKNKIGVVWGAAKKPAFKTKPVTEIFNDTIPTQLLELAEWISEYYAARLAIVLQTILPRGIEKNRRGEFSPQEIKSSINKHSPNPEQQRAIKTILESKQVTHLLHGVTGSGKTLVYRELAQKSISEGKSVIVLVPEIALTPQLASNFVGVSENVLILHSQLSESQRHQAWQKVNSSKEPWMVIGPRSALFSPLMDVGLIVVDECQEPSYVQDSTPKYSALRVARYLAKIHRAKLVLGSATPSVADYFLAKKTDAPIIEMSKPTKKYARKIKVVDLKKKVNFAKSHYLSNDLIDSVTKALKNSQQSLLFHNRRATARVALCTNCGWSAECQSCQIPMRLHHDKHILKCHVCGTTGPIPNACPSCSQPDIEFRGFGSKRIEQEVAKLFPQASVARFDSDTNEKEQIHHRYNELVNGEIDIIIGTQGLAKGLDLPKLSTIGVVSSDTELYVPDFSSHERTFQLISQVLGRAGRLGQESEVFIQTLNPENFVIETAKNQNYEAFYNSEIAQRELGHLPPFTFLLQLQIGYKNQATAEKHCRDLKVSLKAKYPKITVYEPVPAFHAFRAGKHFMQLVVTSQSRKVLVEIAKDLPQNWQFTLDPINLL